MLVAVLCPTGQGGDRCAGVLYVPRKEVGVIVALHPNRHTHILASVPELCCTLCKERGARRLNQLAERSTAGHLGEKVTPLSLLWGLMRKTARENADSSDSS